MCSNSLLLPKEEFDNEIISKYNSELQQLRIELNVKEIQSQLDKLYFTICE